MFLGEFLQAIDDSGALVLPTPYLSVIGSGLVVTRGFDRNLMLFAEDKWEQMAHKILGRPLSNYQVRNFRRRIFSNAALLHIEGGNRILVPRSLRDFAQLEDEVVLSGMYDFVEMWNSEIWRKVNDAVNGETNGSSWEAVGI